MERKNYSWITLNPQAGHEHAGGRPALVLSLVAYNGEFGTYKLLELQGEKVAELKVDGKLASGDDTVAAVISKLRPLLEEKAQSLGENGAQPEFYIEPGDHITLIFNGHKMREDSLFYADNFMMLSAWVQVYLHSCEFEKIIERASELRSQDRGA